MCSNGNILDYTLKSVEGLTMQAVHSLMDLLIQDGIITKKEKEKEKKLYIGKMTDRQGLEHCLRQVNKAVKSIEKWEFEKNYRYSMLFQVNNFDESVLCELVNRKDAFWYNDIDQYEELYPVVQKPSMIRETDKLIIKFNLKLKVTNVSGTELKKRYSIVGIFHITQNIFEIRFDGLEAQFSQEKSKFAQGALEWLRKYLKVSLVSLELEPVADYMKRNGKKNKVVLAGQDMRMATGGKATIDIGNDDNKILPFIGELKAIMEEYTEELEQVPELKTVLDDFIYEKENLSEFPWIKFSFGEKKVEVKFTFNYGKEKGCLLQHLYSPLKSNQGRERLDYVTNYIIDVRNIITRLPDKQNGNQEIFGDIFSI